MAKTGWIKRIMIAAVLSTAAFIIFWFIQAGLRERVPEGLIVASGRIEGREVTISPKIQGRIKSLMVDESDTVKNGQLVAEIASEQLEARYANAKEAASFSQAQIEQASADLKFTEKYTVAAVAAATAATKSATAQFEKARSVLEKARKDYERYSSLLAKNIVSSSDFESAKMQYEAAAADKDSSEKEMKRAEANLDSAKASRDTVIVKRKQLKSAEASYKAAQARMKETYADLNDAMIYAPSDGTILSRPVEPGEVVNPGTPLYVMVDMHRLYVKVYIPEPEIGKIKLGAEARIYADAFPDRHFSARVTKISEQAEFTPKNIETKEERIKLVFGLELTVDNPEGLLKPGMPADAVIRWKEGSPWIKSK